MDGSNMLTKDQMVELWGKRENQFRAAIASAITKGAQFGVAPIKAMSVALETGFIVANGGDWYSIGTDENNRTLLTVLRELHPLGQESSDKDWVFNPIYDRNSEEFTRFI